jgi:TonB family protein
VPVERIIMKNSWKKWEGTVIEEQFLLGEFQGSTDHSAVFVTSFGPLKQKAAIKFVESDPATAEQQFARASTLSHRHLIRILKWGRCQLGNVPMLYLVSEFADENLSQILPLRALSQTETEYMLRSALEVLSYLHNAGYAQAALKPSNFMAVGDDLKLSSDTICRAGEKKLSAREPSIYDAPEVAASGPSPAADIWSLGMVLVETLTQRMASRQAVRAADPAIPDTLPAPFLDIARQCIRLDPERRWAVSDIAARLLPTPAPAPRSPARSPYVWVSLVLLVLFALVAGPKILHHNPAAKAPSQAQVQEHEPGTADPITPTTTVKPTQNKPRTIAEAAPGNAPPRDRPAARVSQSGATPGAVAEKVMPSVSQKSRNTITGKVRVGVRVAVDASGHVTDASLASAGPSQYFANVALQAARKWKFTPPKVGDQPLASQWMLRFAFARGGVEAQPQQVSP